MRRLLLTVVALTTVALGATSAAADPVGADKFANRCVTMKTVRGAVSISKGGYELGGKAASIHVEPTSRFTVMLRDEAGKLIAGDHGRVFSADRPGERAEWQMFRVGPGAYMFSDHDGAKVLGDGPGHSLGLVPSSGLLIYFRLAPARGCRFTEPRPGAVGAAPRAVNPDGTVFGFADSHLHITADMRAGGRVIDGKAFDRFGIARALGNDARNHGPDGSQDVTGNLLRTGLPFGTHDTDGWPTFDGWPVNDTNTHQQVYYRWLERMWMAGERLVVAQTVEDEPLCRIEPIRAHSCNEMKTVALEVRRLRALERYIDAQSGGRGEGWFRLVYGPRQARRAIEQGKLAVVIGVESSGLLGCTEPAGCTRRHVDRGIEKLKSLGIRSAFIAHWVDNGFAGSALEGGVKGTFINVFEQLSTGHYFNTGPCPDPSQGEEMNTLSPVEMAVLSQFFPATEGLPAMPEYPPGKQCNVKGLTKLGAYLVKRMMAEHMLIEVDHMSELARDRVLAIAAKRDYPLVSSHTGTGGSWTPAELETLLGSGGFASATPADAPTLAERILALRQYGEEGQPLGIGLGTDTGGFSSLPGAPEAGHEISYPFAGYKSGVEFGRQTTGERTFDFNTDGVAHYGLFADLLATMRAEPGGAEATRTLYRSAEAYLRTWEATR